MARRHKLKIVEDAAHSLGAVYGRSKIGSCRYADMTTFSFHPVKHITTGEGGAITTNDQELYSRLCSLRTHGVTRDPERLHDRKQGNWYYEMQELGFNYRFTDIQAALGIEQLKKLDAFVARRRTIAAKYENAFRDIHEICSPVEEAGCRHIYHLFIIRLRKGLAEKRKPIFENLQKRGIGVQVHYIPIPAQPYYRKMGYRASDYPNAQAFYNSAISLPIFPKMTDPEVDFVIKTVKDVVRLYASSNA